MEAKSCVTKHSSTHTHLKALEIRLGGDQVRDEGIFAAFTLLARIGNRAFKAPIVKVLGVIHAG